MPFLHNLKNPDQKLFFTKNDPEDPRLGEFVNAPSSEDELMSQEAPDLFIWGYPDDEGIRMNGGRPGAALAPTKIREYLYKMTPHLKSQRSPKIIDLGNVDTSLELHLRHEAGRKLTSSVNKHFPNSRFLALGGGHDYGYCESTAFAESFPKDAVIINFDAHLDVRPTTNGHHSGTPFRRLLEEFSSSIHFVEVGLQYQCNAKAHLDWAQNRGAKIFMHDEVGHHWENLKHHLRSQLGKKLFISLDIDAITSNEAPGCSQSWTTGLLTTELMYFLNWAQLNFSLKGLGIYEVSPPLDQDNRTSKLAALIAHQFIHLPLVKRD